MIFPLILHRSEFRLATTRSALWPIQFLRDEHENHKNGWANLAIRLVEHGHGNETRILMGNNAIWMPMSADYISDFLFDYSIDDYLVKVRISPKHFSIQVYEDIACVLWIQVWAQKENYIFRVMGNDRGNTAAGYLMLAID